MVNSSRAAAAHSWAACGRPGDTWRGELARHASQNEKLESSSTGRNAAGPRLPRRTGGIAQLVERRLCKPNVAGPSPTASTSRRSAAASQVAGRFAPSQVAIAGRKTVSDLRLET